MIDVWYVEEVNKMTHAEKLRIWVHYNAVQLALKYNFHFEINPEKFGGLAPPDKMLGSVGINYLWKNFKILSFDEFISDRINHEVYNLPPKPIQEWYRKFKDEIN